MRHPVNSTTISKRRRRSAPETAPDDESVPRAIILLQPTLAGRECRHRVPLLPASAIVDRRSPPDRTILSLPAVRGSVLPPHCLPIQPPGSGGVHPAIRTVCRCISYVCTDRLHGAARVLPRCERTPCLHRIVGDFGSVPSGFPGHPASARIV